MNNTKQIFDAIIVYSSSIAHSAMDKKHQGTMPFSSKGRHSGYNDSYRYFLTKCKKAGLKAAFCTSSDIIGPGLFNCFWTYDKKWIKNIQPAYSRLIFDKFTPTSIHQINKRKLLTSSRSIYTFNNKKLSNIFQNKLNTYKQFKEFAIPTVEIDHPTTKNITLAKTKLDILLNKHKHHHDFQYGYIAKDKKGVGGFKIYKVNFDRPGIQEIIKQYRYDKNNKKLLSYIIQPFINCHNGFIIGKHGGLIDLRVILINKTIVQTYIRIAKKGNFRCNEHQGGNLVYLPLHTIPNDVRAMTKKIVKQLQLKLNIKHSLYALDFIRSHQHGNLYFIEGNNNPGIDWNHNKRINQNKSKELIDIIVKQLHTLSKEKQLTNN